MDPIRIGRIQSLMKDELSLLINRELKDPRVPFVTVTGVEMTRDAKQATVYISIMSLDQTESDPVLMKECLNGLNHAKGYIKKQLGPILNLRFMPDILFKQDRGLENTMRVSEILKQLDSEKKNSEKKDPSSNDPK